eukprot:8209176-Pyramimonas_sp.AAC.1
MSVSKFPDFLRFSQDSPEFWRIPESGFPEFLRIHEGLSRFPEFFRIPAGFAGFPRISEGLSGLLRIPGHS